RVAEETQRQLVAAVVHVVEDGAVTFRRVLRREDEDVGLELDEAVAGARRQRQIDDQPVTRVRWIDREARDGDDPFIRAHVAERRAAGERFAADDVQRTQLGARVGGEEEGGDRGQERGAETHGSFLTVREWGWMWRAAYRMSRARSNGKRR